MITTSQLQILAKNYQIDDFTIMREYLQLIFLSYLYAENKSKDIYFKGGTAIRLLLDSPRFSEDLDFSTTLTKSAIRNMITTLEQQLQRELDDLKITLLYSGKTGVRYHIKYQPLDFKYPLNLRLDFTIVKQVKEPTTSPLVTPFPISNFPIVAHLSAAEILAEKITALASRNKGRDYFDTWYLLEKGVKMSPQLLANKFLENNLKLDKTALLEKINSYPFKTLSLDLAQFLPKSQKQIIPLLLDLLSTKLEAIL